LVVGLLLAVAFQKKSKAQPKGLAASKSYSQNKNFPFTNPTVAPPAFLDRESKLSRIYPPCHG
jgi:hypothetical protein